MSTRGFQALAEHHIEFRHMLIFKPFHVETIASSSAFVNIGLTRLIDLVCCRDGDMGVYTITSLAAIEDTKGHSRLLLHPMQDLYGNV